MRPPGEAVSPTNADHAISALVLYSEGCPGGEAAAKILREVLSETAPGTEVEVVELSSRAFFELGTPGSLTILVNGRDLFPADEGPSTAASCYRLYATPEGPKSHPTAGMVRESLKGSGVRGGSQAATS